MGKMEQWLSDMAALGLVLCKDLLHLLFGTFEMTDPTTLYYRIEPSEKYKEIIHTEGEDPEWNQIHEINQEGWEYVSSYNRYIVFSNKEKSNIVYDPIVRQGLYQQGLKQQLIQFACVIVSSSMSIFRNINSASAEGSALRIFYAI